MKKYEITFEIKDGNFTINRTNDGFTPIELIGLLEFCQMEIQEQIMGKIKPDVITRNVIQ